MPEFKNKEEYEKWKAEKVEQTKRNVEIVQAKKENRTKGSERWSQGGNPGLNGL